MRKTSAWEFTLCPCSYHSVWTWYCTLKRSLVSSLETICSPSSHDILLPLLSDLWETGGDTEPVWCEGVPARTRPTAGLTNSPAVSLQNLTKIGSYSELAFTSHLRVEKSTCSVCLHHYAEEIRYQCQIKLWLYSHKSHWFGAQIHLKWDAITVCLVYDPSKISKCEWRVMW